jgi:hypothetical protein
VHAVGLWYLHCPQKCHQEQAKQTDACGPNTPLFQTTITIRHNKLRQVENGHTGTHHEPDQNNTVVHEHKREKQLQNKAEHSAGHEQLRGKVPQAEHHPVNTRYHQDKACTQNTNTQHKQKQPKTMHVGTQAAHKTNTTSPQSNQSTAKQHKRHPYTHSTSWAQAQAAHPRQTHTNNITDNE